MDKPDYLPEKLDSKTIKWLKHFGYCLNANDDDYKRIRNFLKKWYAYEYYLYVDLKISEEAKKIFKDKAHNKEFYRTWNKIYMAEKKRIIKNIYGLNGRTVLKGGNLLDRG